jgi:hypothetical protein
MDQKDKAMRGWIGDPQPSEEWHTPGWLSEKGSGYSHFHPHAYKMMGAAKLIPRWLSGLPHWKSRMLRSEHGR